MSSRTEEMRAQMAWDAPLRYRRGAPQRLRGLDVFYDFPWNRYFPDLRAQFVNGQCLADQVLEDCPEGKRPALLLTDRGGVEDGAQETEGSYVMVVNLPRYLEEAHGNAAAAYLANRLGRGITRAKRFSDVPAADAEEFARLLEDHLDADALARWAGDIEERIELLRQVGARDAGDEEEGEAGGAVSRALAAIEALEALDPEIAEAIAALVTTETDVAARTELLWALTDDSEGRIATGQALHARAPDRLEDARAAADRFDQLLKSGSEREAQEFLESQPWIVGLDYAEVRPRHEIPRGAVDFLLERLDGFHDLLELKSPTDALFEKAGKDKDIRSPSSYRLSRPLALALAQVHAYRDILGHEETIEDLYGLEHTREPHITILIGRAADLTTHEKRLLRELNRSLHRVEIVPFDVLGRRAHASLDSVERYLLTAAREAGDEEVPS